MTGERVSFAVGVDTDAAVDRAVAALQRDGVVVLDDLVDPALLARAKAEIEAGYPDIAKVDREHNYGPYAGRHTAPVVVDGTLADPAVLMPRAVEKIAKRLLGNQFMIDTHGTLVSMPGAADQKQHPDGSLFPEVKLDHLLPPFAFSFSLPLVTMDETSGRTAFWLGSHRHPDPNPVGDYDFAPVVEPGSAILWDFRTSHCGLANRGDRLRPVIYSVLSRYWWVEVSPVEASKYEKFRMTRAAHAALKPRLQYRTRRARLID